MRIELQLSVQRSASVIIVGLYSFYTVLSYAVYYHLTFRIIARLYILSGKSAAIAVGTTHVACRSGRIYAPLQPYDCRVVIICAIFIA